MKIRRFLTFASAAVLLFVLPACEKPVHDPGKDDKGPVDKDKLVAVQGFYTIEHEGFKFKIREEVYQTPAAQNAMDLLKKNLTEINTLLPESALKVMKKNPIWLEKDLTDGYSYFNGGSGGGSAGCWIWNHVPEWGLYEFTWPAE